MLKSGISPPLRNGPVSIRLNVRTSLNMSKLIGEFFKERRYGGVVGGVVIGGVVIGVVVGGGGERPPSKC